MALETETIKPSKEHFVYPNPASNLLFYSNKDKVLRKGNIYTSNGELVLTGYLNIQSGLTIDALRPGIYFIEIDGQKFKFVVL